MSSKCHSHTSEVHLLSTYILIIHYTPGAQMALRKKRHCPCLNRDYGLLDWCCSKRDPTKSIALVIPQLLHIFSKCQTMDVTVERAICLEVNWLQIEYIL